MDRFRRYADELALETRTDAEADIAGAGQQWVGVRRTSVRSGSVNPSSTEDGYRLHRFLVSQAPYFLDITPLDVDQIELLWGFDLPAIGSHDAIVFNALYHGCALASLADPRAPRSSPLAPVDCQPSLAFALSPSGDLQAQIEVKTRSNARAAKPSEGAFGPSGFSGSGAREEPISVYLVVRKLGPFKDIDDLPDILRQLESHGEDLLEERVLPKVINPLREAIVTGG